MFACLSGGSPVSISGEGNSFGNGGTACPGAADRQKEWSRSLPNPPVLKLAPKRCSADDWRGELDLLTSEFTSSAARSRKIKCPCSRIKRVQQPEHWIRFPPDLRPFQIIRWKHPPNPTRAPRTSHHNSWKGFVFFKPLSSCPFWVTFFSPSSFTRSVVVKRLRTSLGSNPAVEDNI